MQQDTATDAQEGSGVGEMILECLVVPQDHDGGLLIEAKKGYYVFCRSLLGNSSVGEPQILDVGTQMGPGTLRVTRHESTYGYVVFETKENAEAFAKGNAGIISAAEWNQGLEQWLCQRFIDSLKSEIKRVEERIGQLEELTVVQGPNPDRELLIECQKENLGKLEAQLTGWKCPAACAISTLQRELKHRNWAAPLQESMMSALLDLEAKRPYCVDPTREYSLIYLDGKFVGGTLDVDELEGEFTQHGQEAYWFIDPLERRHGRYAVVGMNRQHGALYMNQGFRVPNPRDPANAVTRTVTQLWDTGSEDPTIHEDDLAVIDPAGTLRRRPRTYILADGTQHIMDTYRLQARIEHQGQGPVTD